MAGNIFEKWLNTIQQEIQAAVSTAGLTEAEARDFTAWLETASPVCRVVEIPGPIVTVQLQVKQTPARSGAPDQTPQPRPDGLIEMVERRGITREWAEQEFSPSLVDFIWGVRPITAGNDPMCELDHLKPEQIEAVRAFVEVLNSKYASPALSDAEFVRRRLGDSAGQTIIFPMGRRR